MAIVDQPFKSVYLTVTMSDKLGLLAMRSGENIWQKWYWDFKTIGRWQIAGWHYAAGFNSGENPFKHIIRQKARLALYPGAIQQGSTVYAHNNHKFGHLCVFLSPWGGHGRKKIWWIFIFMSKNLSFLPSVRPIRKLRAGKQNFHSGFTLGILVH